MCGTPGALTMNRHLIIPIVLLDTLAAVLLAIGLGAWFSPEVTLFKPLSDRQLGVPMVVAGVVLLSLCAPLMLRWFLASMRERSR
jgi:hypothetical protein